MMSSGKGPSVSQKMRDILLHAYEKAPAAREKFDQAGILPGDIQWVRDLERVPRLTKEELMESQRRVPPLGGFLAASLQSVEWVFVSPGPIYEPPQDITVLAKMFSIHGFAKGDVVLNSFSYHLVPAGLLFDSALRSIGVTVIPAGVGNTELQVQIMRELGVTGYVGTSGFLSTLIERAEQLGCRFQRDFNLKRASLTGEMLPPQLRARFENEYGIEVRQFYGTAEVGTIAYECAEREGMHLNDDGVFVEITDPETGQQLGPDEVGEIVITSLNKVFPLIRFRTGDLSSFTDLPCGCGLGSHRLKGILGRIGQATKVRGLFLHPKQLEDVAAKIPEIHRVQAIVRRTGARDDLALRVQLVESCPTEQEKAVGAVLQSRVQDLCKLRIDRLEFVRFGSIKEGDPKIVDQRTWE